MVTLISPYAGTPAREAQVIDVARLIDAYYAGRPDPMVAAQRVAFGTSGHRGSAFDIAFNEWHVLAITQSICDQRRVLGITGPLFMGVDTHALSAPACCTALEVLAANGVDVMLATNDDTTPTPAISHAIVAHNRAHTTGRADGIVMTPSHNPPRDGGLKYNPPHGGPAGTAVTRAIELGANRYLESRLQGVHRMPYTQAMKASTTHRHDYRTDYVDQLDQVIDVAAIRNVGLHMGVDPMGGAEVHYWGAIAERWHLELTVVSDLVDPAFGFMSLDWDGQVRMDPSSVYTMQRLIAVKDRYEIAFACDTDHDRFGIVAPTHGLVPPNHFLCVAIEYLMAHRPLWCTQAAIGKTMVSTELISRLAARLGRQVFEVPVGFKWFADGLLKARLGFAGEESAGASYLRRDGSVWTTDKDGITAALLAAEMTAVTGCDPAALYANLSTQLGLPVTRLVEANASTLQKQRLAVVSPRSVMTTELAGQRIESITTRAAGNGAAFGGIKVVSADAWFAVRPSGTEAMYKIYAESFHGESHLLAVLEQAQALVDRVIGQE